MYIKTILEAIMYKPIFIYMYYINISYQKVRHDDYEYIV